MFSCNLLSGFMTDRSPLISSASHGFIVSLIF